MALVKVLGIGRKKISTVYSFPNRQLSMTKNWPIKRLSSKKYALTTISSHPHKNLLTLLGAFSLLNQRNVDLNLVVAGLAGKSDQKIKETISGLDKSARQRIFILGWIDPNEQLAWLYRNCRLFLFPSLYEGFGFPPLEAMLFKKPVISTVATSLAETIGKAALVVKDPLNPKEWADKIESLLAHRKKQRRLVESGSENVKRFSPKITAKATISIYKQLKYNS